MTTDKDFGQILREVRNSRGLSQSALARALDLNSSHINRIERGHRNPPPRSKVIKIIDALAMTPEEANELLLSGGYAALNSDRNIPAPSSVTIEKALNSGGPLSYTEKPRTEIQQEINNFLLTLENDLVGILSNSDVGADERRVVRSAFEAIPAFLVEMTRHAISNKPTLDNTQANLQDARHSSRFIPEGNLTSRDFNRTVSINNPKNEERPPKTPIKHDELAIIVVDNMAQYEWNYWDNHAVT